MTAGVTAAIAGALITIDLGFAMEHPSFAGDPNLTPLLFSLSFAGLASLYGQFQEHRAAEAAQLQLHRRLDEIEEKVANGLAELRELQTPRREATPDKVRLGRWLKR